MTKKTKGGFTLIEVIIYIGLFSLLLGTAFLTAYQLIDGSGKIRTKNNLQDEANFVLQKISFTMQNASSFDINENNLVVNNFNGSQIEIKQDGTRIKITENGLSDFITTDAVAVSDLKFTKIETSPAGLNAKVKINGVDFEITKYLHK